MSETSVTSISKQTNAKNTSKKEQKSNTTDIFNSSIYNPSLEVDLDNDSVFRCCSNINVDDIPQNERVPPPLTKRLNIELENKHEHIVEAII